MTRSPVTKVVTKVAKKVGKKVVPGGMYGRVCLILESARETAARSVNTAQVVANWLVGREIVEEEQEGRARAGYAERLIAALAERLKTDYGPGYSAQNLAYMKQFYVAYPRLMEGSEIFHALRGKFEKPPQKGLEMSVESVVSEIFHAVRGKLVGWKPGLLNSGLSWTHYRTLLRVDRENARAFYEIEAVRHAWSARELERQIDSLLFERLARSRDKKGLLELAVEGQKVKAPKDVFKDPVVMEFLGLPESARLVESALEQALIDNLQTFLMELGRGFAFVGRQERITLDGDHFYVDLVFYHTVLKCFVLIDLKVGKLTHNDLGQMQFYVNYFDRERLSEGDNPTLGLVLASNKNDAVVKYTLGEKDRQVFTARYQLHLPSEQELRSELRRGVMELTGTETAKPVKPPPEAVKKAVKKAAKEAKGKR